MVIVLDDKRLVDRRKPVPVLGQPEPKVYVVGGGHGFVKAADLQQGGSFDNIRRYRSRSASP
jgi:hypothetical protein